MNIPPNLDKEEVLSTIDKVVNRIAPAYTFYGCDKDDIKQEAFIICIEALNRYNPEYRLENFLSFNLSNRLKVFVRDNYFVKNSNEDKKRVARPAQLEWENLILDDKTLNWESSDLESQELAEFLDREIPAGMRMDYLKILNEVYVNKSRREEILSFIKTLLVEQGYEEG